VGPDGRLREAVVVVPGERVAPGLSQVPVGVVGVGLVPDRHELSRGVVVIVGRIAAARLRLAVASRVERVRHSLAAGVAHPGEAPERVVAVVLGAVRCRDARAASGVVVRVGER
jgi:hypothetical protein